MDAIIDRYSQASIKLSKEEAEELRVSSELEGEIWRTTGETLPLKLKVSKNGWRAEGVPVEASYEDKRAYEVHIPTDGPDKILKGKSISTDMITVRLRKVYISLDNVF